MSEAKADIRVEASAQQPKTEVKSRGFVNREKRTRRLVDNPKPAQKERWLAARTKEDESSSQARYASALTEVRTLSSQTERPTATVNTTDNGTANGFVLSSEEQNALVFLREHPAVLPKGVSLEGKNPRDFQAIIKDTAFRRLRYSAGQTILEETKQQALRNPTPTNLEMRIGGYVEHFEPQVRQAVIELANKGYTINTAGFAGSPRLEAQRIEGAFRLAPKTITKLREDALLKEMGVQVDIQADGSQTSIMFHPQQANMEYIQRAWNRIAEILPNTGRIAEPTHHLQADLFRTVHGEGIEKRMLTAQQEKMLETFRQRPELIIYPYIYTHEMSENLQGEERARFEEALRYHQDFFQDFARSKRAFMHTGEYEEVERQKTLMQILFEAILASFRTFIKETLPKELVQNPNKRQPTEG